MKYAIACKCNAFWLTLKDFAPNILKNSAHIYTTPEELKESIKSDIDVIFFPHWSWLVPDEILSRFNCVCFHSTPLPYGRGGSPVQNMVLNGKENTEFVALKMIKEVDAGPIYMRNTVSLIGGGEEVFRRIYKTSISMMSELLKGLPIPQEQNNENIYEFKRRTPRDSEMLMTESIEHIFDKIRILDIEGYPPAFLDIGDYRLTFTHPVMKMSGEIDAHIKITRRKTIE